MRGGPVGPVQAIFFWNPWVRRYFGLGYIGFVLTWVPFLRAKLFAPFRGPLLADAELDSFDLVSYFPGSRVSGRADEALVVLDRALAIRRKDYGDTDLLPASTAVEYGLALYEAGQHDAGRSMIETYAVLLVDGAGRRAQRALAALERVEVSSDRNSGPESLSRGNRN